jgi:hypothetical protein
MSETQTTQETTNNETNHENNNVLNPVTQKVVEKCVQEALMEYVQQTKHFTADSMHYIRMKVTDLVKSRLGDDEIISVDVGLDLTNLEDIPFFFKLNIPNDKAEAHILNKTQSETNT